MFENQPKGLFALALANTGERFGYYTMLAVFVLFLRANYGLSSDDAGLIYGSFLALVYLTPLLGGFMADKLGYGKMVTLGITIMFFGYLFLSLPLGGDTFALICMMGALLCISVGTGLFKGNLQVMVGNLYNEPQFAQQRDSGFSIFYMAINIGALFAPTAAVQIRDWAVQSLHYDGNAAYHFSFAVACLALVISMVVYYAFRSTFRHVEGTPAKAGSKEVTPEEELSPKETKQRIVALCMVFAVVVFFWMAFHQNGLTLTYFADEFTEKTSTGLQSMAFNVLDLVAVIFIVYALFSFFSSKTVKGRVISLVVVALAVVFLVIEYMQTTGSVAVSAPIFQHFNPFYVVALTPVSIAIFSALARKGKEPSAPRKIAMGMLVAALGFGVMVLSSIGLPTPDEQQAMVQQGGEGMYVSANWLISTYLVLTFAELLLSPMGISFVSRVAPPKYKGLMMGGWFVATALGNFLTSVGSRLWNDKPLTLVWGVFILCCLLSALFMVIMMRRLEKVCK